jgi:hypothetical protein
VTSIEASHSYYVTGEVRDVMAQMPDGSVDLILTSPPFLALRSYLPDDHPDKDREIGSEPDPPAFVSTLLDLSAEWRRVLADHGTLAVELGDTYAGSGGVGGDYADGGLRDGQPRWTSPASKHRVNHPRFREGVRADGVVVARDYNPGGNVGNRGGKPRSDGGRFPAGYLRADGRTTGQADDAGGFDVRPARGAAGWPQPKCLALIPELYRIGLAYGIHPLTGETSPAGTWKVRNVVRWVRPNPPVGSLADKFRPGTSDMVVACTSRTRWFDLDAVRDTSKPPNTTPRAGKKEIANPDRATDTQGTGDNPAGAPPLDWWNVPPSGFDGAHFATWPPALCVRPIKAMCPLKVCRECGEPSRRIVSSTRTIGDANLGAGRSSAGSTGGPFSDDYDVVRETIGWTDCGHDAWRPGIVLDPFAGSGTTLLVAAGHGRVGLGIDIDERNADLAIDRVGPMFCQVVDAGDLTALLT